MKSIIKKSCLLITILTLAANFSHAQLNGFELTPSGNTENYMKYIRKAVTVNGTSYLTGYLTLSSFKNFTTNAYTNDITPFQKLQIQGGNILLCHSNSPSTITDINPTSRNGAILFSDWASDHSTYKHGKWGIEYDNQYSTGGLNIFKPVSQLTSSRVNFNLFISNAGNVGVGIGDPTQKLDIDGNIRLRNNAIIGTWSSNSLTFNTNSAARMVIAATGNVGIGTIEPSAKLQVANGDIFIEDIDRGIIMKSPDGHCWRGILNNQGQLEFTQLPDCITTSVSENKLEDKPLFRISPNPASTIVQISCTSEELRDFSEFSLFDSRGNQLKTGKLDKTAFTINIQGLAKGTYFLNFSGPLKNWSEKLIIN